MLVFAYTASHAQEGLSEYASKQMGVVGRASKESSAEQANEWVMKANERADEQMAQYS